LLDQNLAVPYPPGLCLATDGRIARIGPSFFATKKVHVMSVERLPPVEDEGHISGLEASNVSEKSTALEPPERGSTEAIKSSDVPPDGGYGWVCVASVFIINFHTWGLNSVSSFLL